MTHESAQETTKGISENFSEKPRRGRPPVMNPELEKRCRRAAGMFQHSSRRANVNEYYFYEAMGALWPDGDAEQEEANKVTFAWLGDPSTQKGTKNTIVSELGRLVDPDTIREAARQICERKMRTREAVVRLRRLRVKPKTGSVSELREELIAHVNDYWLRHPEFTVEQFLDAIAELRWAVEEHSARISL
jgi:hypothetical protein